MPEPLPVVRGTLDLLVLRALATGEMHGFGIVSWLEAQAHGRLELEDSAVYQALQRLEEKKLVSAEWGVSENNRRVRYYTMTAAGRAHLKAETASWLRYTDVVGAILGAHR